jgi:hypothetical protein
MHQAVSPLALKASIIYKWLARIFALAVFVQVFLAGLAIFWDAEQWASHAEFAKGLTLLPVLMFITTFIARLPVPFRLSSAALIGMIVLMFVTAKLSSEAGFVSALHPVLALMMFMGAMANARKIDAVIKAKQQESANPVVRIEFQPQTEE